MSKRPKHTGAARQVPKHPPPLLSVCKPTPQHQTRLLCFLLLPAFGRCVLASRVAHLSTRLCGKAEDTQQNVAAQTEMSRTVAEGREAPPRISLDVLNKISCAVSNDIIFKQDEKYQRTNNRYIYCAFASVSLDKTEVFCLRKTIESTTKFTIHKS